MTRFFFHLRDGNDQVLLDPEGVELADMEAMKRCAMQAARGVMAGDLSNGVLDLRYRIDVENAAHEMIYTLAFRHAVSVIDA
ncbi:hypothetical protein [Sphingomonas sp.]|uniref:DUF6894 family protein n=1 Tax=Sphingomonas sp. TaxID=28214 RepID=UPI0035BC047D